MPRQFVAAIDQGTQSTRCVLYDAQGAPFVSDAHANPQIYPQHGWCEHDPESILRATARCLRGALRKARRKCRLAGTDRDRDQDPSFEIVSMGITNQRETTVIWDVETGKPLYHALVWHDIRTADLCRELEMDLGREAFQKTSGLPISTYFAAVKIKWLMENVPAVANAVSRGTVRSW